MSPRARLTSIAALVLVSAALGGPLTAQVPQQAPQGMDATTVALLRIDIRKAQIQASVADRMVAIRQTKLEFYKAQQATGANSSPDASQNLADAQVDFDESQAASETAKLNLQILQLQLATAPANPLPLVPQPGDPTEIAILNIEMKKAQIQAATAAKVAQTRQQQWQTEQMRVKAGQATSAQVADAEMDAVGSQAASDSAALDVEALQTRLSTYRPVSPTPVIPKGPPR